MGRSRRTCSKPAHRGTFANSLIACACAFTLSPLSNGKRAPRNVDRRRSAVLSSGVGVLRIFYKNLSIRLRNCLISPYVDYFTLNLSTAQINEAALQYLLRGRPVDSGKQGASLFA